MFDISRELYAKCWNFLVRLVFSLRCALVSRSNHTGSFREYATEGVFSWENSHRRDFHTGMTFWFRIAFTWWRGYFISRLFERTVHLDKIHVRFKIANITHTLPVLVHLQLTPADRFNTETGGRFAFTWYRCEISYRSVILAPIQKPGDLRQYNILWWNHVLAHFWISVYIILNFFVYILGLEVVWGFLLESEVPCIFNDVLCTNLWFLSLRKFE